VKAKPVAGDVAKKWAPARAPRSASVVRLAVGNQEPGRREPPADAAITLRSAAATVVAAALGAIAGGLAASKLPSDKFLWTGFVLAPLLVLLELFFKHVVGLFGGNANTARFTLVGAIVIAFYGTWFLVRS
jgi:hypothetical protein